MNDTLKVAAAPIMLLQQEHAAAAAAITGHTQGVA